MSERLSKALGLKFEHVEDEWMTRDKARKQRARLGRYSLTQQQFDKMVHRQRGRCAICARKTDLEIDHCHKTGRVRGLLCGHCNSGLAMFRDDVRYLRRACGYLAYGGAEPIQLHDQAALDLE